MSLKLARALLLSLILGAASGRALACSCAMLSAHDRYHKADAVFLGTAVSKTDSVGHVLFHIDESFWGTTGDSIVVRHYDPVICDSFAFTVGHKYLVVAYKDPAKDELTVGACNQGSGIEFASGDLHVLRAQSQGKPLPYVYGTVTTYDGKPIANARIVLLDQLHRRRRVAKTRTQADGYFEFWTVPSGGYLVVAKLPGGGSPIKDSFGTDLPGGPLPGVRMIMHDFPQ